MMAYKNGNWSVGLGYEQGDVGFYIADREGRIVLSDDVKPSDDVASLIEAAPDLLQAAEMIINAYHSYEYENRLKIPSEMMDKIKKAVKKAGGETGRHGDDKAATPNSE